MTLPAKNKPTHQSHQLAHAPIYLTKDEKLALVKLSSVVTTAKNPQAALNELDSTLSNKYAQPIKVLQLIMAGKLSHIHAYGLWDVLKCLLAKSSQPNDEMTNLSYIQRYPVLEKAGRKIKYLPIYNWLTASYFALLTVIIFISITIYKVKILPVYAGMFESFGAQLPSFTQYVISGGFELLAFAMLAVAVIYSLILPFMFRQALARLQQMPRYLIVFPAYVLCRKLYRQYCWQTYARLYSLTGESDPLLKAEQALWGSKPVGVSDDDRALLKVAYHQGSLAVSLDEMEKQLLSKLKNRITLADMFVRLLLLLIFAFIVSAPVIAMYLPLFQMGAVI